MEHKLPLTRSQLYQVHVSNLRTVDSGCTQVYRQLKFCLSSGQTKSYEALLKLSILLVGTWAEVRLLKLLHEPSGFTDADTNAILQKNAKLDQWHFALELAFRHRYKVPKAQLSANSMTITAYSQYCAIRDLLENELRPIVETRNKLAHGQWSRTLEHCPFSFTHSLHDGSSFCIRREGRRRGRCRCGSRDHRRFSPLPF